RPVGNTTNRQLSWCIYVLPQLDLRRVFEAFNTNLAYDAAGNRNAASQVIPLLICPSTSRFTATRRGSRTSDGLGAADYGGMYGTSGPGLTAGNGMMLFNQAIRMTEVTDGLEQTIIVAEDTGRGTTEDGQWANGENIYDA